MSTKKFQEAEVKYSKAIQEEIDAYQNLKHAHAKYDLARQGAIIALRVFNETVLKGSHT